MKLLFDEEIYTVETVERDGKTLTYRAFEHIPYVENPVDEKMQRLSIFVPECYYRGEHIGAYDCASAPIFMPNTVGGYMPGPEERPGVNFLGETNTSFYALLHGYIVVSPGVRGREMTDCEGNYLGTAPAAICDLKAAVRFLRANRDKMPGDMEKIISNGTSAGGALSSLLGSTGNHPDYELELQKLGAARESDQIYGASCYCPITNLDHADMAYEWEFCGINDYHRMKMEPPKEGEQKPQMVPVDGEMTETQIALSKELKPLFPVYVNSLHLKDEEGRDLTLNTNGDGSFKDYVMALVLKSAQGQLDQGVNLSDLDWLTIEQGRAVAVDFNRYMLFRTRMKEAPAFDNVSMGTPENELFGTPKVKYRHFTEFSTEHSAVNGELADQDQIRKMNPMNYIEDVHAQKAKHFRVRHGAIDRDTSLAISTMLVLKLKNQGINAELAFPWGTPHSGDYDLDELFAWIDQISGGTTDVHHK